jgi:hypothetical protein
VARLGALWLRCGEFGARKGCLSVIDSTPEAMGSNLACQWQNYTDALLNTIGISRMRECIQPSQRGCSRECVPRRINVYRHGSQNDTVVDRNMQLSWCLISSPQCNHSPSTPFSNYANRSTHESTIPVSYLWVDNRFVCYKLGDGSRALQRCDALFIIPKGRAMKTQTQPRNVLAELRCILARLDRTGDLSSPSIANLRFILLERINELEANK